MVKIRLYAREKGWPGFRFGARVLQINFDQIKIKDLISVGRQVRVKGGLGHEALVVRNVPTWMREIRPVRGVVASGWPRMLVFQPITCCSSCP